MGYSQISVLLKESDPLLNFCKYFDILHLNACAISDLVPCCFSSFYIKSTHNPYFQSKACIFENIGIHDNIYHKRYT